jgi:hypothetical protein
MSEEQRAGWRRIGADVVDIYRRGGRGMMAAPWLAAIAIVPEAAQHVVEIKLGMFESLTAFRTLGKEAIRWDFGYVKVAGLALAMLAMARFQATGSARRALLPPVMTALRVLGLVALTTAVSVGCSWLGAHTGGVGAVGFGVLSFLLQSGAVLLLVAALVEDRTLAWRGAFATHLPSALVLTLYLAVAAAPAQLLHMANHRLALGQGAPVVWGLMAFDSVCIGLLASLAGAALFVGSRVRLTWRGWQA